MSKIKKLTTRFNDSMVFAPKMVKRMRTSNYDKDEEDIHKDIPKDLTMDEALNYIYTIYNQSDNIFSDNEYLSLDSKTKKEIDKLKGIIQSIYNNILNGKTRISSTKESMIQAKIALSKLINIKKLISLEQPILSDTQSQPTLSDNSSQNPTEEREICSLQQLDETKYEEIKNQVEKQVKERLILQGLIIDDFKIDINTGCNIDEIVKRIKLKLELIENGYFDINKLNDVIIDYVSYDDIEELGIEFIADVVEDFEKYKRIIYTPKQLKKSYEQISESFIIDGYRKDNEDSLKMVEYIKTFKDNPEYMLRTLLWLDTFHDFKNARIGTKLNNIIQEFYPDEANYDFDVFYRNSFFEFENKDKNSKDNVNSLNKKIKELWEEYEEAKNDKKKNTIKKQINEAKRRIKQLKVSGFSKDIVHTVLSGIENNDKIAKLLFDVSEIVINKSEFESDLFYAYMIVKFDIKIDSKESFMVELKNILWNQISAENIPYYAKDVDRGSGNLLQGNLVILPASIFDANPSNSSDDGKNFVKNNETLIPFANGYNFEYKFNVEEKENKEKRIESIINNPKKTKRQEELISKDNCFFILNYTSKNKVYTLTNLENKCLSSYDENNYKDIYKSLDQAINDKDLNTVKVLVGELYFNENIKQNKVRLPENTKGMSPGDIVTVIIGILQELKGGGKRELTCGELDFWVSLKRIGDYGQILQCKQLGIPLFTTDSMQLLISLAVNSSVIWSPDFTKVLWYNADNDAIMCNGYNPLESNLTCSKKRIKDEKSVVYRGDIWSIERVIIETNETPNKKYRIKKGDKFEEVTPYEIQPYDINYMLFKQGFKPLENAEKLLKDTVDKNVQILKDLKPIPNIREKILEPITFEIRDEVKMKEA
jgi:hypothetical protein